MTRTEAREQGYTVGVCEGLPVATLPVDGQVTRVEVLLTDLEDSLLQTMEEVRRYLSVPRHFDQTQRAHYADVLGQAIARVRGPHSIIRR